MQRTFIGNLGLLLFLNLLIKPLWIFGIDRTVQNVVGAEDYGFYYALLNFSFLFNMLLDVGITNFNTKNIAQHQQLVRKHFSGIATLRLLLAVIYMLVIVLAGWLIGYSEKQILFLVLLGVNQFLLAFILYMRSNLAGMHRFVSYSLLSVLDRAILIVLCALLLWGGFTESSFKIEWFVYAQTGAYLLTAVIAFIILFAKLKSFKLNWNLAFFAVILKQSFPFAMLILLMTFYNRIDSVMLERMLPDGAVQAGIYAQGYRILDAVNMVAYLFAGLLLPIFARMIKLKQDVENLASLSFRLLAGMAIILAVLSFSFQEEIMDLLYHQNTAVSAPVYGWLMLCFVPVGITYVFGTLLTANGNLKALNIMAASGMVLNVVLNFILIPKYYALGSAWASFSTQCITAGIQFLLAHYIFKFTVNWRLILSLIVFVTGVVGMAFLSDYLSFDWAGKIALLSFASVAWLFVSGFLNPKHIYRILRYKQD